jgi:Sec-independent protein secretion pathway component TatC
MVDSEKELEGFGALDYIQNKDLIHIMDSRKNLYIFIFLSFFIIGFPISEYIIDWLMGADGFIPENVQIVIIQPLEKILLQIKMAGGATHLDQEKL